MYAVELTEEALAMLEEIADSRVQGKLLARIKKLALDPEKQGIPLVDNLRGYRSIRAVGQRYRIIYEINNNAVRVLVVGIGIRKEGHRADVYVMTAKRIRGE